jgi:hypothetical protein
MRRLTVAIAAILALAALVAGSAAATTVPSGGKVAILASLGADGAKGKVVIAGAIGDYGTTANVDKNGKMNPNGNFVRVTLKKGTFEIANSALLNKSLSNPRPQVASSDTCSVAFSAHGTEQIFNGTGLYKGIAGTATVTITMNGIGPRYASGPNKGQCQRIGTVPPLTMMGSVIGQGTVHFAQ